MGRGGGFLELLFGSPDPDMPRGADLGKHAKPVKGGLLSRHTGKHTGKSAVRGSGRNADLRDDPAAKKPWWW
jgi:hypothetical protein